GPDPRNFNQRVSLGRNDLLIRTFPNASCLNAIKDLLVFGGVNDLSALLGKTLCAIILSIRSPSKLKSTLAIALSLLVSMLFIAAYEISNAYAKTIVIC
ncbi:hypothetical protein SJZ77_27315, partial [Klebsiella pneumoniae]|nr:hypothetical protein [Klebsiella pneumoniae]